MDLLLAGGAADPNLSALSHAAHRMGLTVCDVRHGDGRSPAFQWDLTNDVIMVNGMHVSPAAAFLRYDVFGPMGAPSPEADRRAMGWYQTIEGCLRARPAIRVLNRDSLPEANNKIAVLLLARSAGLRIPATVITNEVPLLRAEPTSTRVAKPVAGGGYCRALDDVLSQMDVHEDRAAMPALVQRRLAPPEIRIYLVGSTPFAFEMQSPSLDYRCLQDVRVVPLCDVPPEVGSLRALMARLKMDFGAADFKTDPVSGALVFLELNTSPMFARFDEEAEGRLSHALLSELMKRSDLGSALPAEHPDSGCSGHTVKSRTAPAHGRPLTNSTVPPSTR